MTNATPIDVIEGRARFCVVTASNLDALRLLPDKSVHHCLMDPPYSEHCHSKSRAGSRKTPLLDGNGHLSRCAIDREVDFGFDHITQQEMEDVSDQLDRLVTRWSMAFSDIESCHLWKGAMSSAGLEYWGSSWGWG
jgi:site-specific DNA-methyltransferase (adenine-specific)